MKKMTKWATSQQIGILKHGAYQKWGQNFFSETKNV